MFGLLAGLSIELVLKATATILERPYKHDHKLVDMCDTVGITLGDDHRAILEALTEFIYWHGRYPTPKSRESWEKAREIFINLRSYSGSLELFYAEERAIDLENYSAIWSELASRYWEAKELILEP